MIFDLARTRTLLWLIQRKRLIFPKALFINGQIDGHPRRSCRSGGGRPARPRRCTRDLGLKTTALPELDVPALDCAYKLQEYAGRPKRKGSEGKATWPGRKQVFRNCGDDRTMIGDLLTLEGEAGEGKALIHPVMRNGQRIGSLQTPAEARQRASAKLLQLPTQMRQLKTKPNYPVTISRELRALADEVDRALAAVSDIRQPSLQEIDTEPRSAVLICIISSSGLTPHTRTGL